jgi:large subunit ribosomal protein L3
MKFILGKKFGMSQKYNEQGDSVPVTVVKAEPCQVTQVKTKEKDGYQAVQISYGKTKREFRTDEEIKLKKDDKIDLSKFQAGDKVKVTGISKGRGFQGVVKRHHFAGSPASHGHKDQLRMPGSIGERSFPGKVFKGQKMGGHMGAARVTVRNLKVIAIEQEKNLLYLKGAVPGARKGLLLIYA